MKLIVGILVFIFVLMPLITWLINTFHIYGLKLVRCRYALLSKAKLRPFEQQLFDRAETALLPLGFVYSHTHQYADIVKNVDQTDTAGVYWHPAHQVYVQVSNPKMPDTSRPIAYEFIAHYPSYSLIGKDREAEGVFKGCEQLNCVALTGHSLAALLESFLMKKTDFELKHEIKVIAQFPAHKFIERMAGDADDYLRYLLKQGWVKKKSNQEADVRSTVLCITFFAAMKLSWQLLKQKTANKLLPKEEHEEQLEHLAFLHQAEAQSHQRANSYQGASQMKRLGKLLLFIGSVVFFGLVIGIAWEPLMVLLLVPVLLFHELGHYWAMKSFGYRDLQIMFLPIGAVAIGKKEEPTVLQKTWVALAGPVPGLLVALVLVLWQPAFLLNIYMMGLVFMLVVINYLNIMPFMPLDGGHVVNTLLFDRWPLLQLLFKAFGVAVFAYFSWAWSDPIVTFLAVFLGFGLVNNWREFKLIKQLDDHEMRGMNEHDQLVQIYQHLGQQNSLFPEKMALANAVTQRFRHAKPKLRETVMGMTVYLFFLTAPVVFVDQYMDMDLLALFSSDEELISEEGDYYEYEGMEGFNEEQWDISYYQKRIEASQTAVDKKLIYQESMDFAKNQEYGDFVAPLASKAVALYEDIAWQKEVAFKEWKRMALTTVIFENEAENIDAEWQALEQLMADDQSSFFDVVSQTMYSQRTHLYEPQFKAHMEQIKAVGDWDSYAEMFLSLNAMKGNRGEISEKILASEAVLQTIPSNESYAINRVKSMYVMDLFANKQYQKVIDVNQTSQQQNDDDLFSDQLFQLNQVIWAAIELRQLDKANKYIDQYRQILEKQNEEMMDAVGFIGRLALSQSDVDSSIIVILPMDIAMSLIKNDDQQAEQLLNEYFEAMAFSDMSQELQKSRLTMMWASSERDGQSAGDMPMKYILQAIIKFRPELLNLLEEA